MDVNNAAQEDTLKWMQMEALGARRRERITTSDFRDNHNFTSVSDLESTRKDLGASFKPLKEGQEKILAWQNIHHVIHDDGTATPGDLQDVNEGLGQSHRAKLMQNPDVRAQASGHNVYRNRYQSTGKSRDSSKLAVGQRSPSIPINHQRMVRSRIVKGDTVPSTTSPLAAKSASAHLATASTKSNSEKGKDNSLSSEQVAESVQRQNRANRQNPVLTDPKTFLASIQGFKIHKPEAKQTPQPRSETKKSLATMNVGDISSPRTDSESLKPKDIAHLGKSISPPQTLKKSENAEIGSIPSSSSRPNTGAVSLAYLLSLNINFTPEQLSLLKVHSGDGTIIDEHPETSTSSEQIPKQVPHFRSSIEHEGSASTKSLPPATRSKASLVSYASSSSDSAPSSPELSKAAPAAPGRQGPHLRSAPPEERLHVSKTKPSTSTAATTAQSQGHENPHRPNPPPASVLPRSEILRHQREMIIGSQVVRTRYSHVAGSLVDKFKALSLRDPAPTNRSTTTLSSVVAPILDSSRADAQLLRVAETRLKLDKSPTAASLFRPQFIPDVGNSSQPPVLAPRSVNEGLAVPAKSQKRSSGLSLPPHLRGRVADSDPGAAARAQYGGRQ